MLVSKIYTYLKEKQPTKQPDEVTDALLVVLMALEGSYLKTKNLFLEQQLKTFGLIYGEANGWVQYTKKRFLKENEMPLGELKRELKFLEAEGYIQYHRFAQQTFIELIKELEEK